MLDGSSSSKNEPLSKSLSASTFHGRGDESSSPSGSPHPSRPSSPTPSSNKYSNQRKPLEKVNPEMYQRYKYYMKLAPPPKENEVSLLVMLALCFSSVHTRTLFSKCPTMSCHRKSFCCRSQQTRRASSLASRQCMCFCWDCAAYARFVFFWFF